MEKERQKLKSSNPNTIIDKKYIESNEYRRKYDEISDNKKLNRLLYDLARKMLLHRNGTNYEDMYWIDPVECKVVAKELDSLVEKKIIYSERTQRIVRKNKLLITIHSHPDSFPPSVEDLNSNYENNYSLGVVCGHNGNVFIYSADTRISEELFVLNVLKIEKMERQMLGNNYEKNEIVESFLALQQIAVNYRIKVKEVS